MLPWPFAIALAFACGSIPFGLILGRLRGVDIRQHGSKNIGATNVGRVLGRRWGLLCFALDALKGAAPVVWSGVANTTWGAPLESLSASLVGWWLLVAVAALLGHMFSPWVGFRGGKGVATGFGALAAMWQPLAVPALAALIIWLAMVRGFRFVSLASMVAAASLPVSAAIWAASTSKSASEGFSVAWPAILVTALLAALVVFRHRANIGRLRRGEEPKVGDARNA